MSAVPVRTRGDSANKLQDVLVLQLRIGEARHHLFPTFGALFR